MTRDIAIEVLTDLQGGSAGECWLAETIADAIDRKIEGLHDALAMAIEALKITFENDTKIKSCSKDSDLIGRQAAIDALYDKGSSMTAWGELLAMKWSDIQKCIEQLPSADRPRGEWIDIGGVIRWGCSLCHYAYDQKFNFCPNCGADMRGDTE